MDLEVNKALIRRFTEIINAGDWDVLDEVLTQDFRRHCQATPDVTVESIEDMRALQESFQETFPDQRVTPGMMVAEGDKVACMATYAGTHLGPMGEIPPTGKRGEVRFLTIFRIEGGKIAELWAEWDNVAFLTQLGLFPPPG